MDDRNLKRIGGRVSPESFAAWHELHARTGASISAMLEILGPTWLRLLDDEEAGDLARRLIAEAFRVTIERSQRD